MTQSPTPSSTEELSDRLHERLERLEAFYRRRGRLFQAGWIVLAVLLSLAGLALIPLPGPGAVVAVLGLGMLAPAFGWARTLLHRGIDWGERFHDWSEKTRARHLAVRVAGVLGALIGIATAVWWLVR